MDNKSKIKLFIENFVVYGMGGAISSAIPVIMIPVITRLMPNSSYIGISDMATAIISIGNAFALMGMYDSMYRLFFENDSKEYKREICSTSLAFTFLTSIIVAVIMIIFKKPITALMLEGKNGFLVYICALTVFVGATNSIVSAPIRMQNRRKIYLVLNTLCPLISYSISIPLILNGHYVIALPLATLISNVIIESSFLLINREWFQTKKVNIKHLPLLLKLSIPQIPNLLVYWVFNSCDRIMILNLLGMNEAGIYGISAKLGHVSQLIYTAFIGGWQYFSFSVMKDKNQVETNSKIFEYLGVISYVATGMLCVFVKYFFRVLFPSEYMNGAVAAPYLFLSPLLLMMFQVNAYQFLIKLKSWPNMLILGTGALVNIILNKLLIPILGIEGAAISTVIGYLFSVVLCSTALYKIKLFNIHGKFVFVSAAFILFFVIWRLFGFNSVLVSFIELVVFGIVVLLCYYREIKKIMKMVLRE